MTIFWFKIWFLCVYMKENCTGKCNIWIWRINFFFVCSISQLKQFRTGNNVFFWLKYLVVRHHIILAKQDVHLGLSWTRLIKTKFSSSIYNIILSWQPQWVFILAAINKFIFIKLYWSFVVEMHLVSNGKFVYASIHLKRY